MHPLVCQEAADIEEWTGKKDSRYRYRSERLGNLPDVT